MTENQQFMHTANVTYNLYKTGFSSGNHKGTDHTHLSSKFRKTLYNTCNLELQTLKFGSCLFYNLSNYDANFIINDKQFIIEGKPNVIFC